MLKGRTQLCIFFGQLSICFFEIKYLKNTYKILEEITTNTVTGCQKFCLLVVVVRDNQ